MSKDEQICGLNILLIYDKPLIKQQQTIKQRTTKNQGIILRNP